MQALLALLVAQVASVVASSSCEPGSSESGQALLQTKRSVPTASALSKTQGVEKAQAAKTLVSLKENSSQDPSTSVNPSGAAATLDETGYVAVADRCCQSEMIEFTQRQIAQLGLEVCEEPGLRGVVPYHSCEFGMQSFERLTADLLRDSVDRCGWLRPTDEGCAPLPNDCPEYKTVIPFYDCGCNRTTASVLDFSTCTVTSNNLGGVGPVNTDPQEIRYSSGTSYSGKPFDLVITTLTPYTPGNFRNNGKNGGFGRITLKADTEVRVKFSFVEPGTSTPVVQDEVHMATYDLDGALAGGGMEYVSSIGYSGYVTDPNPNLLATLTADGHASRIKFTSIGESFDNPSDPDALTANQRRNAVMFFYKKVSEFTLTFGIEGGDTGRTLYFSFLCALNDRCGH